MCGGLSTKWGNFGTCNAQRALNRESIINVYEFMYEMKKKTEEKSTDLRVMLVE